MKNKGNKTAGFLSALLLSVGLCYAQPSWAQRTEIYAEAEKPLKDGIELFQKQKYSSAQQKFEEFLRTERVTTEQSKALAFYYYATCAVELFHQNAEYLLTRFIAQWPSSSKVAQAWFQLGKIHFRGKNYPEVLRSFTQTDVFLLTKNEYFEYYYKKGYSEFMTDTFDAALKSLAEVKDKKNIYQIPATYYFGHISYLQKNYETALQHFLAIKDDKNFSKIVPYYIAQIYYRQGKYAETVQYGEPIMDTLKAKNASNLRRILAESYFELKDYSKAIENYNKVGAEGSNLDRNGHYKLGLSYYRINDFENAARALKMTTSEQDSMSQSAYYYMADCFIRLNTKRLALDALKFAYTLPYDARIAQEAHFNFAKLSFELGYNPYNEAIDAVNEYLAKYPTAKNKEEAYELLVDIYLTARNYKDALASLEKIPNKNSRLKIAEQRIHYFRAIELFNNLDFETAIVHFKKATQGVDAKIAAESYFWLGDAYYRQKNYVTAEQMWETFLTSPGAKEYASFGYAYYNIGYAKIKQEDYAGALTEFRTFTDQYPGADDRKLNDAFVRMGDCFFMTKSYDKAQESYDRAIRMNKGQMDYALFQKGVLLGLNGNHRGKSETLRRAANDYPSSPFRDEILYELGNAYVRLEEPNEAIKTFESIVAQYPKGGFVAKSYVQLGLIYKNRQNDREALGWFKRVVDEYQQSSIASEALKNIKSIYIESGDVEEYTRYVKTLQFVDISTTALDSITFEAADNMFKQENYAKAAANYEKYLAEFPNGAFAEQAAYYGSVSYTKLKETNKALTMYELLIQMNSVDYMEEALYKAGEIYLQRDSTAKIKSTYMLLEQKASTPTYLQKARTELMRIAYKTESFSEAIQYAKFVLTFEKINPSVEDEANMILANSYYQLQDFDNALATYRKISAETGSENFVIASYRIGEILYLKEDYKQAEKDLRKNVKAMGAYKDWLAKSFILLGDIYIALNDYTQAKAVLKTVIDRHEGEALKAIAQEKYDQVIEMERQLNQQKFEEDMEFDVND